MDLRIAGKRALVLGSTGGLGGASARALAAEGCKVAVCGRQEARVREVAAELPGAVGIPVDLTGPQPAAHLLDAVARQLGGVDILVLNGPGPRPGTAADLEADALTGALDPLLDVHVRLVHALLPAMREARWGRVLAIGSSGVAAPLPNLAASNIGRWALAAYLKTLAAEVAQDGVTVNLVLPGRIATDRVAALDEAAAQRTGKDVETVRGASQGDIPARRYGAPEEFGDVVAFLASARASYVTGSAVRVDGGLVRAL
ncbi:putative short chain dehydrogenase [Actinacidiphila reveromycinica]|uniref:Putative short chain dehydrogenase n=1 Tax=Actinacidiphila reveromycinica TaxID=659352 RepID=A0A7U3VRJ7_9ACTN|nr:SDR family oxidoreductase [Streptomyces sp. SN-593]BBB00855.1 putative short chain dehydrogenase [Streptomyces sp. SN-593]